MNAELACSLYRQGSRYLGSQRTLHGQGCPPYQTPYPSCEELSVSMVHTTTSITSSSTVTHHRGCFIAITLRQGIIAVLHNATGIYKRCPFLADLFPDVLNALRSRFVFAILVPRLFHRQPEARC